MKSTFKVKISPPKIDRLSFMIYMKGRLDAEHAINVLTNESMQWNMKLAVFKNNSNFLEVGLSTKRIDTAAKCELKAMMHITVNRRTRSLRFDYNPTKVDDEFYARLNETIPRFTPYRSFDHLLPMGKITRIDIARDFHGMNIEDCVAKGSRFRAHGIQIDTETGKLGTIYFGCKKGNYVVIYNKRRELERRYECEEEMTRFECRETTPEKYFRDLLTLGNPLERVDVFMPDFAALDYIPEHSRRWFLDSCRLRGMSQAIKLGGYTGKEARQILEGFGMGRLPQWLASRRTWRTDWTEALKTYRLYDAAVSDHELFK